MRGENLNFTVNTNTRLRNEAIETVKRIHKEETDWKQLVEEGKARLIITPELNGYRYHYERITS